MAFELVGPTRVAVMALTLVVSTAARAQLCAGFPSLNDRPLRLAGYAASSLDAGSGNLSFSGGRRVFGSLAVGTTHFERLDYWSTDVDLGLGFDLPLGSRASICPLTSLAAGFGPNNVNGTPYDLGTVGWSLGVSGGGMLVRGSSVAVIPSGFVRVAWTRTDFADESAPLSDVSYVVIGGGVGLAFGRTFTLRPAVSFPLGEDERGHPDVPARQPSSRAVSVTLAIHLGGSAK